MRRTPRRFFGVERSEGGDLALDALSGVDQRHRRTIMVLLMSLHLGRKLETWLTETLAVTRLDASEFMLLAALWIQGPPPRLSAGSLAERVGLTSGGTTKAVQRLSARGLLRKVDDPADGRRSIVELTEEGVALAGESLELVLDTFDMQIGDLNEAEREGLASAIHRLISELTERLNR